MWNVNHKQGPLKNEAQWEVFEWFLGKHQGQCVYSNNKETLLYLVKYQYITEFSQIDYLKNAKLHLCLAEAGVLYAIENTVSLH